MSQEVSRLTVEAPAKINLFLEVLGRRPNGYHDIRSVVVPVSLFDIVVLELADEVSCDMFGGSAINGSAFHLPPARENLATKAAQALRAATGYGGGARITIEKHIPIGGGLGGGSADAAATLIGLNALWDTGLPTEDLMAIGLGLGCDIPAQIHGGVALVEGLGEQITPVTVQRQSQAQEGWLVLASPGFSVSTRDVYERCNDALTSPQGQYKSMVSALEQGNWDIAARSLYNGLQQCVVNKYPLIRMLAAELQEAGAVGVLMSGSGASVFGLASCEEHANRIAAQIGAASDLPVWCVVAKALPDGVMAAHGPLEARV